MAPKSRLILLALLWAVGPISAQTPAPVVVQAIPAATASAQSAPAQPAASANSALQALQELKAANDELLKKQAATMLQLDEIQKAAEQLKIYSKRG